MHVPLDLFGHYCFDLADLVFQTLNGLRSRGCLFDLLLKLIIFIVWSIALFNKARGYFRLMHIFIVCIET